MNVAPQYTADELKALDVVTPDLINKTKAEAQNVLNNKGIKYKIEGTGDKIVNQIPKPNTKMPANGMIILYLNNSEPPKEITVPNIIGKSPLNSNTVLINSGLNMTVSGAKTSGSVVAVNQSPAAGSIVPVGSIINVEFRDPSSTVE
jgi:stage V sporulation protein D (sporulation-specific penicillin-binding protein)